MQAHETAYNIIKLHASPWNCMQAHRNSCKLMDLHAIWNVLEHSTCILEVSGTFCMHSVKFWNILLAFWMKSGTFWNIMNLYRFAQSERISTWDLDRQTYIRTCWAAFLQLKRVFPFFIACYMSWKRMPEKGIFPLKLFSTILIQKSHKLIVLILQKWF